MLLALGTVRQGGVAPIKHLRTTNPYVGAALGEGRSRQTICLPRQSAGLQQQHQHASTAGTSSFGMSGVNAHLLLSAAESVPSPAVPSQVCRVLCLTTSATAGA